MRTPRVEKLLNLLSSKTSKPIKPFGTKHHGSRVNLGVTEKATRFARYYKNKKA
jgi:hypothetical protein